MNRRRYNFNLTTSILSGDFSPFSTFLTVLDIDSIYLTLEDLDKIMAADLPKFGIGHEHHGEKKAWIEKQELTDKYDYFK